MTVNKAFGLTHSSLYSYFLYLTDLKAKSKNSQDQGLAKDSSDVKAKKKGNFEKATQHGKKNNKMKSPALSDGSESMEIDVDSPKKLPTPNIRPVSFKSKKSKTPNMTGKGGKMGKFKDKVKKK